MTATALTAVAATVFLAPAPRAAALVAPVESAPAGTAVAALTGDNPAGLETLPQDFAVAVGYQPGIADGLAVDPDGECSSPVALPAEFATACKAHDLGYDLLRYAAQRGEPLGPWARQALDATLDRHLRQACATRAWPFPRARCEAMAAIATTAVDVNSRRQDYGVPIAETPLGAAASAPAQIWTAAAALAGGSLWAGVVLTVRRRRFQADAARKRVVLREKPRAVGAAR